MEVGIPIQFFFGFEPQDPKSATPDTRGSPAWGDDKDGFIETFQKEVQKAWSRKYPLYGERRPGTLSKSWCKPDVTSPTARELKLLSARIQKSM